jgi:DNA-binding SARP family transcriptional activator/predicted ATPase
MLGDGDTLVGRADELEHVGAVLGATRLVTLTGPAGAGKSRLAAEVARSVPAHAVARLREVADAAGVASAVAAACGVREQPGRSILDALVLALADRDLVLVLDDAEDVRDVLAPIVERLRVDCPRLRVLVTSRVPLRGRHETVVALAPLDDVAAAELARLHGGDVLDDAAVDSLVRDLGGNALAIVVAARTVAGGGAADTVAPGRDVVTTAITSAIEGLTPSAREVLARLAVMPAGAPGDALGDPAAVDELVDRGLASADAVPPRTRYRIGGPVREIACTRLGDDALAVARRARDEFLRHVLDDVATAAAPGDERRCLDAAEAELPNVAAAIADDDAESAAAIAAGAARVWLARARFDDGARQLDAARRAATGHRGRLCYYAGAFAHLGGRLADAAVAFEEAETAGRASGDDAAVALGLTGRATVAFFMGDRVTATDLVGAATELAARADDPVARLSSANLRATLARITGDLDQAERDYAEAVAIARSAHDHRSLATALLGHGSVAQLRGAVDEARSRFVEAREVADAAGYPALLATALGTLGALAESRGDLDESRSLLVESLAAATAAGEHRTQLETLVNLAGCEIDLGDHASARHRLGDALALARRLADRRLAAFALAGLAECALTDGDVAAAARLEREALVSRRDLGDRRALALALEETADIVARTDRADEAMLLLAGADVIRVGANLARSATESARAERVEAAARRSGAGDPPAIVHVRDAVERAIELLDVLAGGATGAAPSAPPDGARRATPVAKPVVIRTLGGFAVEIGGVTVPAESWGSRRARQLVKMLVAARGRPVAREQLTVALWPDASADEESKLGARLSVLLSTARKALGGAGLVGDRTSIGVDLAAVDVDVELLLAAVAAERSDEVVDRYAGDFLPEDVYEEWSTAIREQARLGFLAAARRLARSSAASGAHERAAELCLRTLDADPYDDDAHRLLVGSLASAGRHGEASRAYQQYAARMNELGIEPPPLVELTGIDEAVAVRR